jgi:hypothetical protein
VHFALPNGAAATLDVFDVAWRLVDSRDVSSVLE